MTMSQHELESYLWGAANLLRGVIDPGDYKSIIFPIMFFKRLSDVYDEESEEAFQTYGDKESANFSENHMFQIPDGSHWKDVRRTSTNVGFAISQAMANIEKSNPERLLGIFGDINWTNKERLSDRILNDLIEHFSSVDLSLKNVTQDEFGNAYEYLIKKFADDSGHSAAEFYTNRTVVRLMTLIIDPQPGESIYDPTCGSGGMLLNARLLVKEREEEFRTLKLYGQEINIITSAIARMNMFIHGVQDFEIDQGDTLKKPRFMENNRVMQFDICLANPPYSMKKWDRELWKNDPWGRNIFGTPPQGAADYAFFQHIICSLKELTGRCAILWPHGILFRDSEEAMRAKLVESDYIDTIIGLGPELFYNSPMESCIVICRKKKPFEKKKKILFINGVQEIVHQSAISFLSSDNIKNLFTLYHEYRDVPGKARVVTIDEIREKRYSLNIPYYVEKWDSGEIKEPYRDVLQHWTQTAQALRKSFTDLKNQLEKCFND
jgi:type I restriction enzyme M protein